MTDRLAAAMAELVEALREEVRSEAAPDPRAPDRLYSVGAAMEILSIGRSRLYDEIAAGRLRSVKSGRRRLVSASALAAYVDEVERAS